MVSLLYGRGAAAEQLHLEQQQEEQEQWKPQAPGRCAVSSVTHDGTAISCDRPLIWGSVIELNPQGTEIATPIITLGGCAVKGSNGQSSVIESFYRTGTATSHAASSVPSFQKLA